MNERQKRKVMFAFAERFGRADVLEQDVNVPGWDAQMVYALTAQYEANLANINAISGVQFGIILGPSAFPALLCTLPRRPLLRRYRSHPVYAAPQFYAGLLCRNHGPWLRP